MEALKITNGCLVTPHGYLENDLWVKDGVIITIDSSEAIKTYETIDASGCYVTPGLIDIHIHGGAGCNFLDCQPESIRKLKFDLIQHGVSAFLPTIMTGSESKMIYNISFLSEYAREQSPFLPEICGINLEGPFLSEQKKGIHSARDLKKLSINEIKKFLNGSIKIVTIAPELDPVGEVISYLTKHGIIVSIGHSEASYEQSVRASGFGARLVTHLYNAMTEFHHRSPGLIAESLMNDALYIELIADGVHIHPAAIKLALKIKPNNKIILISDSIALRNTDAFEYFVGADRIHVEGNRAVNAQGVLSGSILALDQSVKNLVRWGLTDFCTAINYASYNPAMLLGINKVHGSILPGSKANIILWDKENLSIKAAVVGGKLYILPL